MVSQQTCDSNHVTQAYFVSLADQSISMSVAEIQADPQSWGDDCDRQKCIWLQVSGKAVDCGSNSQGFTFPT